LFAGTFGGGVFLSTNHGGRWTPVSRGLTNAYILALASSGMNLFAGTSGGGVFLSTNNGASWIAVNSGLTNTDVRSLVVSGSNLFVGTNLGGVFVSTNTGASWAAVNSGLTNTDVRSLVFSGTNLFAGTMGGVFPSTNNGASWTALNSGLENTFVVSLTVSGANLLAGTIGGGVWRRPLSEMTSVDGPPPSFPKSYNLDQNYPNPFNPVTTISFSIPSRSFVRLSVYDALGKELVTLLSRELSAGSHAQQWNAKGFPSGIYFYRMSARTTSDENTSSFVETRKLILLK
jgi:hypothetical protein